ncbi:signal transduction histidine kinase [Scopulibacillus daqui]|uniref:histidine kinase n=1 Tax=Scopulibacillus daqui TaxID=1469162 RepID=A0ABS2Q314_9BACL|nr:signal transduction histidine kinase [Scopulibacillus daqui]
MEQSIIKDIRQLYTKSILWTIIMTVITVIISILIILVTIERPANYNEKLAHKQSEIMENHPSKYINQAEFNKKKRLLQKSNVTLNKYHSNGKLITGSKKFSGLFKGKNIIGTFNETIFYKNYYHLVQPAVINNEIKEIWVYSYQLKSQNMIPRYITFGFAILPFIAPIIYFIIFSRYFINKLYRTIKEPLEELLNASNMIRKKDLDFCLGYNSNNEIGQLTQSFRQMQRELKKSLYENWRKDSEWAIMMSSLSHDLKTPATLIALSTEILNDEGGLAPNQQLQVDIINRNITKINNILKSMGHASNIKDPTLIDDVVSLDELIQDLESDIIPLMEKKNIQYKHDLRVNKELRVPYLKINRILENLFANAIQYTPENGEIHFFVEEREHHIHFAIEDSGPGIKRENRGLVFSKHFREDAARANSLGNAGLGLFIVKNLVKELNGQIEFADPLILSGTRIEFAIPYK